MKKTLPNRALLKKSEEMAEQVENWIRLKQYLDLLPFEYSYSFECDYSPESHDFESQVFVQVGEQHWSGSAYGYTEYASLAESLRRLESVEVLEDEEVEIVIDEEDAPPRFRKISMKLSH